MGDLSKNHRDDDEGLSNAGLIPFKTNKFNANPGETLSLYISLLNPENEYLFQRFHRPAGWFNLDDPTTNTAFENIKVGENKVDEMMPFMCKAAGIKRFTNHSVR